MRYISYEKDNDVTKIYYELTWPIYWEKMLLFTELIITNDFLGDGGKLDKLEIGSIAGAIPKDYTNELKEVNYSIMNAKFAKEEMGFISISGFSRALEANIKLTIWNQLKNFLIEVNYEKKIEVEGERAYDRYADSIEILGSMTYADYLAREDMKKREQKK